MKDYNEFRKKTNRLNIEDALVNPSSFRLGQSLARTEMLSYGC